MMTNQTESTARINFLVDEKRIIPAIAQIDLELVKLKLIDEEDGPGWTMEKCNEIEIEYKRFLQISLKYPNSRIVPNKDVDLMWHFHILDTEAYYNDCNKIFGKLLHHYPYLGMFDLEGKKILANLYNQTLKIYEKEFNEISPDQFKIASACSKCGTRIN